MNANTSNTAPDMFISEAKKGKEYHQKMSDYIISGRLNWDVSRSSSRYWDWYHQRYDARAAHNFLLTSDKGEPYPVDHASFNEILPHIEFSIGDLLSNGFEVHSEPHSKAAMSRRRAGQLEIESDFDLFPFYVQMQEMTGLPVVPPGLPQNEKELEKRKKSYKERGQIVNENLITHHIKENRLDIMNALMWEQANVAGSCHIRREFFNGKPVTEILSPDNVVWDTYAKDPYLSDAWCIGVYEYLPLPSIATRYNIDMASLGNIHNKSSTASFFAVSADTSLRFAIGEGSSRRLLVVTSYWKDFRKKRGTHTRSNGIDHYHVKDYYFKGKRSKVDKEEVFDVEQVRKCVTIGGEYVPEGHWGIIPNQARSSGIGWNKANFPIVSFVPRMNNGRFVTTLDLLIPIQKIVDRSWVMIQKAMRNDRGKAIRSDRATLPENWSTLDQMFYAESYGSFVVDSRKHGIQMTDNQFGSVDMSISSGATFYLQLYQVAREAMGRIMGIPDSRMGFFDGAASQRVGVARMSQSQSSIRSSYLYKMYYEFLARVHQVVIQQDRWGVTMDPERYAHIIGDEGVAFVEREKEFGHDDYGIFVNTDPVNEEDRREMKELLKLAVSAQQIDIGAAGEINFERNPRDLLASLEREIDRSKQEASQREQDMLALQQQQQQQAAEAERAAQHEEWEYNRQMAQISSEESLQALMIEHTNKMKQIRMEGKVALEKVRMQQGTSLLRDRIKFAQEPSN